MGGTGDGCGYDPQEPNDDPAPMDGVEDEKAPLEGDRRVHPRRGDHDHRDGCGPHG